MSAGFSSLLPLLATLLLSLAPTTIAMPVLSDFTLRSSVLNRRDDQGLTHSWADMSSSSQAGVIVAPALGFLFVLFAAFFVVQEKRREAGKKSVIQSLPCFRRKPRGAKRLTDSPEPAMTETPGGIANAGVAAG